MLKCILTVIFLYNDNTDIKDYEKFINSKIIMANIDSPYRKNMIDSSIYNIKLEDLPLILIHKSYINDQNDVIKTELYIFKDNIIDIIKFISNIL